MKDGHKVIDMHTHTYTKEWLDYMAQRAGEPVFQWTGPTSGVFKAAGVIAAHVDKAGDYDVEARIKDLDQHGIDTQELAVAVQGQFVLAFPDKDGPLGEEVLYPVLSLLVDSFQGLE